MPPMTAWSEHAARAGTSAEPAVRPRAATVAGHQQGDRPAAMTTSTPLTRPVAELDEAGGSTSPSWSCGVNWPGSHCGHVEQPRPEPVSRTAPPVTMIAICPTRLATTAVQVHRSRIRSRVDEGASRAGVELTSTSLRSGPGAPDRPAGEARHSGMSSAPPAASSVRTRPRTTAKALGTNTWGSHAVCRRIRRISSLVISRGGAARAAAGSRPSRRRSTRRRSAVPRRRHVQPQAPSDGRRPRLDLAHPGVVADLVPLGHRLDEPERGARGGGQGEQRVVLLLEAEAERRRGSA